MLVYQKETEAKDHVTQASIVLLDLMQELVV